MDEKTSARDSRYPPAARDRRRVDSSVHERDGVSDETSAVARGRLAGDASSLARFGVAPAGSTRGRRKRNRRLRHPRVWCHFDRPAGGRTRLRCSSPFTSVVCSRVTPRAALARWGRSAWLRRRPQRRHRRRRPPRRRAPPAGSPVDASRDAADASRVDALATAAELFVPVRARWNVNATVDNARAAAHLAAAALKPDPLTLFPVDETTGRERFDQPPLGVAPMKRRLTRPRGVLGAYDILSRADEAEDDRVTDAEPEPPAEGVRGIERASVGPPLDRRPATALPRRAPRRRREHRAAARVVEIRAADSIPAPTGPARRRWRRSCARRPRRTSRGTRRRCMSVRSTTRGCSCSACGRGARSWARREGTKSRREDASPRGEKRGRGARGGGRGRGPAAGTKRRTSHARADPDPYVWGFGSARKNAAGRERTPTRRPTETRRGEGRNRTRSRSRTGKRRRTTD